MLSTSCILLREFLNVEPNSIESEISDSLLLEFDFEKEVYSYVKNLTVSKHGIPYCIKSVLAESRPQ